ncbi:type II toxin-antitoxin system ParD family antitoxin [Devosia marina]|uniref:Type II toxin-antitoxin system ParD family antitoxin n=1 Tax=Devosia marina TaxID=2683198 RepID=A0A7X3K3P1_9HYPH|nr:type II toxin-antitoxin system ParD family antitoxin [Devosia marina]MVS99486.1 type II toxin-antitoxin system ParD family antitoxin [Devosia marina]
MAISADLGEVLEKVVTDLVENGRYNSKSEVLREGVRLVQEREARLRTSLDRGTTDSEEGRTKTLDEVADRLIAKYQRMADEQAQ